MSGVPVQTRVPEDVAAALRERAKESERSLAAEVRLILKATVESGEQEKEQAA